MLIMRRVSVMQTRKNSRGSMKPREFLLKCSYLLYLEAF